MTKAYAQSDSEIAVRSLLMRLYHSRKMGEPFYHAALVNGEAPALEAKGWIERHGEGWRLTEAGVQGWSEMNVGSFNSRYYYKSEFYEEMRERAKGDEDVGDGICKVEGCTNPRMVNSKGEMLSRCEDHMREYWRADAARKREIKKKVPVELKRAGQWHEAEPTPPTSETTVKPMSATAAASNAVKTINESVKGLTPPDVREKVEAIVNGLSEPLPMDEQSNAHVYAPTFQQLGEAVAFAKAHDLQEPHDCKDCYAKGVIEALRAKSPKLAALIDAMEAQERAAHELGL